jgi:hypothetical protein
MTAQGATFDVRWDPRGGCYRSYASNLHDAQSGPHGDCVHRHRTVVTAALCAVRREKKQAVPVVG